MPALLARRVVVALGLDRRCGLGSAELDRLREAVRASASVSSGGTRKASVRAREGGRHGGGTHAVVRRAAGAEHALLVVGSVSRPADLATVSCAARGRLEVRVVAADDVAELGARRAAAAARGVGGARCGEEGV